MKQPKAEGWTKHIPYAIRRMKLSEALSANGRQADRNGEVFELDLSDGKGGAGFAFKPREGRIDRGLKHSQSALRVEFDQPISEVSIDDRELIDTAVYDYEFEPRATVHSSNGRSHISKIEYSTKSMLLRATFWNGAVVVYGSVPPNVFARLQIADQNGQSVGAVFWDYIRIYDRRGLPVGGPYNGDNSNFVQRGSKFPFIYETDGTSTGPRPEAYQVVRYDPMEGKDIKATKFGHMMRAQRGEREFENLKKEGIIEHTPPGTPRSRMMREFRKEVSQLSPETLKKLQEVIGGSIADITAETQYKDEDMVDIKVPEWFKKGLFKK